MISLRTTFWVANLFLTGVVAYTVGWAGAGWLENTLTTQTPPPAGVRTKRANDTPKRKKPLSDFQAILDVNMFRAERSEPGAALALSSAARPTVSGPASLALKLTGTFVAGSGSFAMVVGGAGNIEQLYRQGECLPRGLNEEPAKDCKPNQGQLTRVRGDHIVVNYNGQDTVVKLETGEEPPPPEPRQGAKRPDRSKAVSKREATSAVGGAQFPAQRDGNNVSVQVPSVEVEKAFENFTDILKQARVVPFTRDGQTAGFQIRKIAAGSIFHRLGLQNFDVIETVNGQSLTNADQALRLFTLFKNETEINMEVRRRNENLKYRYRVE